MEEELRCPSCKQFFNNPVLLPCYHALCIGCAVNLQQPASQHAQQQQQQLLIHQQQQQHASGPPNTQHQQVHPPVTAAASSSSSSDTASDSTAGPGELPADYPDVDKLSILSETDSGVVCNSRPNSYVGTPNMQGILLFPPLQSSALSLMCPACHKVVYFDENGAHNLPKYRAMTNIVEKYCEARKIQQQFTQRVPCQLCAEDPPRQAVVRCEQCDVWYCEPCREGCHPARGPLAKHTLLDVRGPPNKGPGGSPASHRPTPPCLQNEASKCAEHTDETLSLYCMLCKVAACPQCVLQDSRHTSHDVQAISAMCKAQKTELSQNLQQLSEKAKCTTEFIHRLKGMTDKVSDNCTTFESTVEEQCLQLAAALEARKQQLLEFVRQERELRLRSLREQVTSCTARLQQTTALLQFCIEALKETDSVTFLQVGSMLITRVANADLTWHKDVSSAPRVSPEFDLTLDDKAVLRAMEQLNFIQMKPAKEGEERQPAAPAGPTIIPEECSAENNSVTVAWQPPPTSYVEGYVLELDDGCGGDFREVYCGKETICTVDGLHFHSMYNARVRAFNSTGEGPYSECIGLQTAEVAWFTFEPNLAPPELRFSEDNATVTGEGYEHRVALGSVGFSRGVHYWEFSVDRYDADADPSFGVARLDVNREQMLGKDDKGWSMYIDRQRSWFMHGSVHEQRCEGGILTGATVGVLLDLERRQLSFYVNEEPQGPIAFRDLYGVFYPAVSVNRGVTVTLHTALDAPSDSEES